MQKQPGNNTQTTFYNPQKTNGDAVFPLFIVDILVSGWVKQTALTVSEIQAELLARGIPATRPAIRAAISNIFYTLQHPCWDIYTEKVRRGTNKAVNAFYIQFKTEAGQ